MKKGWIIFIIFISIISTLSFYFFQFNNGLSLSNSDWGSFGDYLNGVLTPILTIINIWVFIRLTEAIDSSEKKQKADELSHRKKLLLIQLRQNELEKFSSIVNDRIIYTPEDETGFLVYQAHSFLDYFVETKSNLFPIMKTPKFNIVHLDLKVALTNYLGTFDPVIPTEGEELVKMVANLRCHINSINTMLQDFVLSEIQ